MQILINIPNDVYEYIKNPEVAVLCEDDISLILLAIHYGIVLPKGHGDLIDRSQIKWFGCDFESFENCHIVNDDCSICSHATCLHDDVMSLPKVISADKEEGDAEC